MLCIYLAQGISSSIIQNVCLTPSDDYLNPGGNAFHLLAKAGCKAGLQKILYPENVPLLTKDEIVKGLLEHDNAGWSPLMRVLQADKDENDIMGLLLRFLDENIEDINIEKIVKPWQKVKIFVSES